MDLYNGGDKIINYITLYLKHITIIIILNKRKWKKSIYYKEEYNEKRNGN